MMNNGGPVHTLLAVNDAHTQNVQTQKPSTKFLKPWCVVQLPRQVCFLRFVYPLCFFCRVLGAPPFRVADQCRAAWICARPLSPERWHSVSTSAQAAWQSQRCHHRWHSSAGCLQTPANSCSGLC